MSDTAYVIQEMTEALWLTPASSRVDSITNFQHTWAEGDDLIVEDLFDDIGILSDIYRFRGDRFERLLTNACYFGHETATPLTSDQVEYVVKQRQN